MTASTMGTISAVVPVLEIQMERNAVVTMKPNMSLLLKRKNVMLPAASYLVMTLPSRTGSDAYQNGEGDSFVQVAVFHRQGQHDVA